MKMLIFMLVCLGSLVFSVSAQVVQSERPRGQAPTPVQMGEGEKDPCDNGPGPGE